MIQIYAIGAIIVLVTALGWGQHRHSQGVDEEKARWESKAAAATKSDLESLTKAVSAANTIAQGTQDAVGKIRIVNKTVQGVLEREIKTDVRYVNDCLPATGRMQWDAVSKDGTVLPASPAVAEPVGGRNELPAGNVAPAAKQPSRFPALVPRTIP